MLQPLIVNQLGRAAEFAVLPDPLRVKDTHGLAAATSDGSPLHAPAPHLVGEFPEGLAQVYFLNLPTVNVDLVRHLGPTVRTVQALLPRIPFPPGSAGRTSVFLESSQFRGLIRHGYQPGSLSPDEDQQTLCGR